MLKPWYKVWWLSTGGWWWQRLSDYPDRVEIDWVETWPRTLASASDATLSLLPPTLAAYIAMAAEKRTRFIRHDVNIGATTTSNLLVLTARGLIDPTGLTNTSCFPWDRKPVGETAGNSPLGKYCPFCGSAIVQTLKQYSWDSSSDTTLCNGKSNCPKIGHVSYSLTLESHNANRKWLPARTLTLMPLSWKRIAVAGKSMLWLTADGNFALMYITSQLTMISVGTELAKQFWR